MHMVDQSGHNIYMKSNIRGRIPQSHMINQAGNTNYMTSYNVVQKQPIMHGKLSWKIDVIVMSRIFLSEYKSLFTLAESDAGAWFKSTHNLHYTTLHNLHLHYTHRAKVCYDTVVSVVQNLTRNQIVKSSISTAFVISHGLIFLCTL